MRMLQSIINNSNCDWISTTAHIAWSRVLTTLLRTKFAWTWSTEVQRVVCWNSCTNKGDIYACHSTYYSNNFIRCMNSPCLLSPLLFASFYHPTAVAQWLRCCVTNQKVAGSIPAGVNGIFINIKSFRPHYGPGVDSASNRNEYQEYFLGVKAAGA